ncbi:MAG: right-handed parallel beta-helix repeat-containing protein [Planctomycetota bacterium]|jgi:pectate lyase|nr:right-handed parallel beta-helix repeat-containing protein [Planctomycetota bacterium]MDP7251991.1 right-handed parallel beta-helix repeat-containing protein [Planctomycetota bacterium]
MFRMLILLFSHSLFAEANSCQGYGADTRGGDDSPIVEVTSLADSGPGTLRTALSDGNRRVIFKVGGTIELKSRIEVKHSRITLDGFTAPAQGITITKMPLAIRGASNVIVRNLRFRDSVDDNIRIHEKSRNIVIDHCSCSRAGDGAIDITQGARDVTVSWCLLAETDKVMLVDSVTNLSIHHNLFFKDGQRHPQLHNVRGFDVRNNVIRQWRVYGIRARAGSKGNIINNFFGLSSNPDKPLNRAVIIVKGAEKPEANAGAIFIHGNVGPGKLNMNVLSTASKPYACPKVDTLPASEVEAKLRKSVGARPLDTADRQYLSH